MAITSIIDIGTNTIHLIVARHDELGYEFLLRRKFPARLGEGGTEKNHITTDAIERGIQALTLFKSLSLEYGASNILAFATAMLRNASNSQKFISIIKEKTGIDIQVISGDQEASYIFRGIKASILDDKRNFLAMDIGGGSTEFMYSKEGILIWKHSFRFGATSLLESFISSDPINQENRLEIENFIDHELFLLWDSVPQDLPLIGASGSFDSFAKMIHFSRTEGDFPENEVVPFNDQQFYSLFNRLISSNFEERSKMTGLAEYRIHTIIPSSILLKLILQKLQVTQIWRSPFALKEGAFLIHCMDQKSL